MAAGITPKTLESRSAIPKGLFLTLMFGAALLKFSVALYGIGLPTADVQDGKGSEK